MGFLATADLLAVAEAARELGVAGVVLTSGQRLMLPGLDEAQEQALRERFGHLVVEGHDLLQACPGAGRCPNAKGETGEFGQAVERMVRAMAMPAKIKVGVSACANCCAESKVRDLGFVAGARGWTVFFGGNAGKKPRVGDELGRELTVTQALDLAREALERYAAQARQGERTARFQERMEREQG